MSTTTTTLTRKEQLQEECRKKGIPYVQKDTIAILLEKLAQHKDEPAQPVTSYRGEY